MEKESEGGRLKRLSDVFSEDYWQVHFTCFNNRVLMLFTGLDQFSSEEA